MSMLSQFDKNFPNFNECYEDILTSLVIILFPYLISFSLCDILLSNRLPYFLVDRSLFHPLIPVWKSHLTKNSTPDSPVTRSGEKLRSC